MELLLLPSGKDLHSNCFIFLHPNRYSVNQKFICFCLPACLHSLFAVCFLPARACLKNALRKMCVTICGRFCSDEGVVAGYDNRIRTKYTAKWGVQIAGMIFQTRSNVSSTLFYTCRFFCISSLNSLPLNNITATRNRKHINAPNILTVGFFTTLHKSKIPGRINPYPAAIIS